MKSVAKPQDTEELLSRLQRVTPSSARQWGKMTPHQALCHLSDSFRGVAGGEDDRACHESVHDDGDEAGHLRYFGA